MKFVTLEVSFEETLRRVTVDPSVDRVATRNPEVLRWHHDQFTNALPFLRATSATFDANNVSPDELAMRISRTLQESTTSEPSPGA